MKIAGSRSASSEKLQILICVRIKSKIQELAKAQKAAIKGRGHSHWRRRGSQWSRGGSLDQWSQTHIFLLRSRIRIRIRIKVLDQDPDAHQTESSDPDPHHNEKRDSDPHQGDPEPQHLLIYIQSLLALICTKGVGKSRPIRQVPQYYM